MYVRPEKSRLSKLCIYVYVCEMRMWDASRMSRLLCLLLGWAELCCPSPKLNYIGGWKVAQRSACYVRGGGSPGTVM